ncbi:MAG: PilC/PilY family type IV pilus protein [Thermodesulfovibrionales bacterium]
MKQMAHINKAVLLGIWVFLFVSSTFISIHEADAATMQDYCVVPPFVSQSVPPLVMFEVGREHKLYYEAYNDASDYDDDGRLDVDYKHSIDYYGYFDFNKCYTYSSSGTGQFTPVSVTTNKFCSSGQWSGNVLNWITMSRMDVLRKVLYGGHRVTDSNAQTVLERVYIPQDAHSWGKELTGRLCFDGTTYTYNCWRDSDCASGSTCVDKSTNLVGITAADAPNDCSFFGTISKTTATNTAASQKILVGRYYHDAGDSDDLQCGIDHANILNSYEPANLIDHFDNVQDFSDSRLDPATTHTPDIEHYNIIAVVEFQSDKNGNWQFFVDGDDGVELEILTADGTDNSLGVVASRYGCHASCPAGATPTNSWSGCTNPPVSTPINLANNTYYRMVVRHSERTGFDGVKVWVKRPGNSTTWNIFPFRSSSSSDRLTTRTWNIVSGADCTIQADKFIAKGSPVIGVAGKQHLFCNTTLSDGGTPIMRKLENKSNRIWEWASKERPVCDTTFADGSSVGTPTDYTIRVEVCKSSVGLEPNCKNYSGTYKPTGLLQKYGEGQLNDKVCSKVFTKKCNTDTDCAIATEGMCIDKSQMYFGLMTDSYTKNLSGGVLRKNIGSITDETNLNNGIFQTSENVTGNIIMTMDRLKTVGFRYSDYSYQDPSGGNCGWITDRPLQEGECRMWGNPIGEMMYESLRYFAGKGAPTPAFTYSGTQDSGLNLSKPDWGYNKGSTIYQPYQLYPSCARPFILVLSDVNTSYDNDQLPGAYNSTFTEDAATPKLNINVSTLADTIGTTEAIPGHNWYIGESGSTNDFICSSKNVSSLSTVKGMCPEEPTKKGTYYSAAVAYYGRTLMNTNTAKPNVNTYSVALSSPVADLKIKAGSNYVTIVPMGKSVSGCLGVYDACASHCTFSQDASDRFVSSCTSGAFCPSNQIVDVYADTVKYDSSNNVIYAKFRINYEDVEQGADHDMDDITTYEICTQAAVDANYGSCAGTLGTNIQINLTVEYAAGCIDQISGFVISGTTEDGVYLPVRDKDVSAADGDTPASIADLPLTWSKIFTTSGNPTGFLKNPLWFAAKWGGFDDLDGSGKPFTDSTCGTSSPNAKCAEWDKDGDGVPDNYFLVVNPLKLEDQLNKALLSILRRASSGTAASVLASGEGSGANIVQAIFYPKRLFNSKEISWTGSLENLWYYVDPRLESSSIREDTVVDKNLIIDEDNIVNMYFDQADQKTKADLFASGADGTKAATKTTTVPIEELKFLWEAGSLLHSRNLTSSSRTIKTSLDGTTLIDFSSDNTTATALQPHLQASSLADAKNIIQYVRGESDIDTTLYRDRSVTNTQTPPSGTSPVTTTGVWRLGDIVSSTPRVVSWMKLGNYHETYKDTTYQAFLNSDAYKNRGKVIGGTAYGDGMVFAGANDGMLHAFYLGAFEVATDNTSTQKASLKDTANMGKEAWTFVPKNSLPYLKYLMDKDYCHLYYLDATPVVFDASVGDSSVTGSYWDATRTVDSWRTILIGGMRLGGACKPSTGTFANGVKTPIASEGYSSYFALDITNPANPTLLWEFSRPADNDLGFSTTGPAIVRINARDGGSTTSSPNKEKNGKWFVVFASGPTGPISNLQFKGFSDQNLKLFVLDLKTGALLRTIDTVTEIGGTELTYAFGGSLNNANIDYDLDYQDDALYFGYTTAEVKPPTADTKWTNGGVIRLITREDLNGTDVTSTGTTALNPANWKLSYLMKSIGSVTSSVSHLAHYPSNTNAVPDKAWLYFGTGRFSFREDDPLTERKIFSVKENCLSTMENIKTLTDPVCSNSDAVVLTDLDNVTTTVPSTEADKGWYIRLIEDDGSLAGERVITNPLASAIGAVFFTTFTPKPDICQYGGSTHLWGVKHDTGGSLKNSFKGKGILQVSTGVIEEVNLRTSFTEKIATNETVGRRTGSMDGVPPTEQGLSIVTPPKPTKKVLHIRER